MARPISLVFHAVAVNHENITPMNTRVAIATPVLQTTSYQLGKAYRLIGPARLIGGKGYLQSLEPVEAGHQRSPSCCTYLDKLLGKALIPTDMLKALIGRPGAAPGRKL